MKKFRILFLPLLLSSQCFAFAGSWTECKSDSECIKVPANCGGQSSVNKQLQKEFEDHVAKQAELISCIQLTKEEIERDKKSKAKCVKNNCKLVVE